MKFFQNYFGPALMKPPMQIVVMLMYILYMIGAVWGCYHLRRGVSFEKLSNTDSFLANYYEHKDIFFNQYSVSVGVVITDAVDYSDPKIQADMDRILQTFTNDTEYFCDDYTVSWLRDFVGYLEFFPRKPKNSQDF